MKGIAFAFFVTGVVAVTLGMFFGMYMGMHEDFTYAPAHAHLNLVGWVTFGLFGVYYHLTPQAAQSVLARVHYMLALAGLVTLVPGIVQSIANTGHALSAVGTILTILSMLLFLFTVVKNGFGPKAG